MRQMSFVANENEMRTKDTTNAFRLTDYDRFIGKSQRTKQCRIGAYFSARAI